VEAARSSAVTPELDGAILEDLRSLIAKNPEQAGAWGFVQGEARNKLLHAILLHCTPPHSHSIASIPFNTLFPLKKMSRTRGFPDTDAVKNSGY
jgi:hypothetical protein